MTLRQDIRNDSRFVKGIGSIFRYDGSEYYDVGRQGYNKQILNEFQRKCLLRLLPTLRLEQEDYMLRHPEIKAMVKIALLGLDSNEYKPRRTNNIEKMAKYLTMPPARLDEDIRNLLKIPPPMPYDGVGFFKPNEFLFSDLNEKIVTRPIIEESEESSEPTQSSSFVSLNTSATTPPTPVEVEPPEISYEEMLKSNIYYNLDKAIFAKLDEHKLHYDFAFVELTQAVEDAMELTVEEIKLDIATLYETAFDNFETIIKNKESIAARIAYEKRMRKKLKKGLRLRDNFKGYVTPPTPKSTVSSHESYLKPLMRPCKCFPPLNYNRYPKDRYGIYLPQETTFACGNITLSPPSKDFKISKEILLAKQEKADNAAA